MLYVKCGLGLGIENERVPEKRRLGRVRTNISQHSCQKEIKKKKLKKIYSCIQTSGFQPVGQGPLKGPLNKTGVCLSTFILWSYALKKLFIEIKYCKLQL